MIDSIEQVGTSPNRPMRWAAVAFAIGFSVHAFDHLLRGITAAPPRVLVIGTVQGVFVVLAVRTALTGRTGAPVAAAVGFGSALLFTFGHLLPLSLDSYVSAPDASVTWFSWLSAIAEIGTGIAFGLAGVHARLTEDRDLDMTHRRFSEG